MRAFIDAPASRKVEPGDTVWLYLPVVEKLAPATVVAVGEPTGDTKRLEVELDAVLIPRAEPGPDGVTRLEAVATVRRSSSR